MPNHHKQKLPIRYKASFSLTPKRAIYSMPPGKSQESFQAEQKSWRKNAQKQLLRNLERILRCVKHALGCPSYGSVPRAHPRALGTGYSYCCTCALLCWGGCTVPQGQSLWDPDTEPKYCENGKTQPIHCLKSSAEAQAYGKQFAEVEKDGVPHVPGN